MKKTLLSLLFITSMTVFGQDFSTGVITFNSNLSAQFDINGTTNQTTLTLVGPSNAWFAVGFGGSSMGSGADVFRTDGTTITDAKTTSTSLPAADGQQDWTLVSNDVSGSSRTIIATRANNTGDSDDFVFNAAAGSISMIWAHGSSTSYAYHGGANRGATAAGVTLGISQANRLDFAMFPNPSSDFLNIQLPSGTDTAEVSFYDTVGRLILTQKVSQADRRIDVQNLNTGIYILRVNSGDKIGAQQFIKK
jgi:hypothetical protein